MSRRLTRLTCEIVFDDDDRNDDALAPSGGYLHVALVARILDDIAGESLTCRLPNAVSRTLVEHAYAPLVLAPLLRELVRELRRLPELDEGRIRLVGKLLGVSLADAVQTRAR